MLTNVPLGPRSLATASSVVQPLVVWPSISAITSPRRMPLSYAGEPSNTRTAVMSPFGAWMVTPSP